MYAYYGCARVCASGKNDIVTQVKEFKRALPIPKILPTPGSFQGAQFEFNELLMKLAKEEVAKYHIRTNFRGTYILRMQINQHFYDFIFEDYWLNIYASKMIFKY